MKLKKHLYLFLVIAVLIINFIIRIVGVESSPNSVNWDEASIGVNAKYLMETGRDEFGNKLPIYLKSFGDYKPALYAYLTIPFIKIFGLNQFSVRLVSAISGTLGLWGLFCLGGLFVKNKWLRLWWIIMAGLGPLRFHYSRVAVEANLALMWLTWGLYFWYKKRFKSGLILFILGMMSYHSARIVVPAFIFMSMWSPLNKRIDFKLVGYLIISLVFLVWLTLSVSGSLNRFGSESLMRLWPFGQGGFLNQIYFAGFYLTGHLFSFINPNNWLNPAYEWLNNSVTYVAESGLLGMGMSILVLIGVFQIKDIFKKTEYQYLIYWFGVAMIPVVITWNWFYPLRSLNALIVLEILGLIGLQKMAQIKLVVWCLVFFVIWEAVYTVNNEYNYTNFKNYQGYQAMGIKEISNLIKDRKYSQIIVDTKQEHADIFYKFYLGLNNKIVFREIDWTKDLEIGEAILVSDETSKAYMTDKYTKAKVQMIKSPLTSYYAAMVIETN